MADNSQNIFQGGKDWNKITFEGDLRNQPTGRDIFQGAVSSPKPNAVDETFQNYADEKVTREQYLYNRQAYSTNEDSLKIRQSWETTPHISIENGKLKLSGTQSFLESDTAKQLRAIFDEMRGQTYNTEALNQQIEAWNQDLQAMAKGNLEAVNAMDAMNKNIMENGQNEGRTPLTWDEFRRITQSAAVGRDANAANSDSLIFVGYEWDDEGHQTPKYVKAKDFYDEFNNIKDEDKRAALSALYTQAGEGDAGAASKLAYLTGGQNTPVNVTYDPMFRFKDTLGIFAANTLTGLADAADFVTMWTFFGLPRQAGKVTRGLTEMANGGDFLTGYGESDLIQQKIRDYREVVNWQNQYFMELTPGSTELAAMSGSVFGGVLGVAYSLWAGGIASQAGAQAASTALSKAGDALLASGNGVARTFEINAVTGKVQLVQYMNGAQVVGRAPTIANGAASTLRATVVLPKGLYEAAPKLAEAMANVGGRLALETKIAAFSRATGGLSAGEREFLSVFTTNAKGAPTNIAILTGEGLSALRMEAAGLQLAARLAPLMGSSALRNVDNYYALSDESRPSDMSEYVIANTAKDVIAGATIMGVGVGIHSLIGAANAAKVKPTRFMDTAQMASGNTQGGFYSEDPTWTWSYKTPPTKLLTSGKTNIVNKDIIKKATSVVSANGENFFFTQAGSILTSAIPGALNGGIGAGVVTNNAIKQMRIEPAVGGVNLVTDTTDILTGKTITETQFYPNPDDAERELGRQTTPTINPSTLMNSDLAATGNIVPFKIGGRSALKYLPNGVSRARIQPNISYLTPSEYAAEVTPIVEAMTPELRAAYEKAMVAEDIDSLSQQIYAKDAPAMDAPRLFVPRTEAEAIELAQSVARAQAVAAANPNSSPVMPVQTEPDDVEVLKRRRMVTDRVFYAGPPSGSSSAEKGIRGQDAAFVEYIDNSSLSDKMKEQIINNVAKYYTSPKKVDGVELSYLDWTSLELYQMSPSGYTNRARELLDKDEHDYSDVIELRTRSLVGTINKHKQERPRLYRIEGINGQTYTAGDTVALPLASFSKSTDIFTKSGRYLTTKMYTPGAEYYIIEIEPGKYGSLDISDIAVKPEQQEVLVSDSFTVKSIEEMDTPPGDIKSSKCYKVVLTPTDVDAGVEQVGAKLSSPYAGEDNVSIDDHGVKVKRVRIGDHDVPIDYEIADRIAELNKNGFVSYNSHSGIAADHESPGDAGGGYIQFNGAMDKEKLSAIKKAADAAGMNSFEEYNMFYGPVMLVYQHKLKNGQTREDIIRQANINTAKHYGLPRKSAFVRATNETSDNKSWLTILDEQGKFNEGLDYRDNEITRLEEEAGGYALDTDDKRKESWDKFFSELGVGPAGKEVDGHSYTGGDGYQKFISDNLTSSSGDSVKDRMLAIAVEQSIVTPGGDTDNINPLLRSGELVLGGDGEPTSIEFKEKIDSINIYDLAANYYHNMDYFNDGGSGDSGIEQNIVDLARELLGKKPLKNIYEFSSEDIAAAEKVIRDALEDGVINTLKRGNYTLKNDSILYRVVSEGGNNVNQGGDLSWLDKQSGEYSDKGFTSVTLNEDAVLNSPVLSGTGKKYILRYHIPSGENIYAFDGSVRTGEDTPLGDFRRVSSGHRAGGEFMLTPGNNGIFVKSGEFKDGAEYVDVYIGSAADSINMTSIEVTKKRKTIEVEQRTPRNIAVTEYGLPKKWFSNMDEALDYKNESAARSIYKIDESAEILDRPPVTMDNIYTPSVRGEAGLGGVLGEQDFSYTPNTADSVAKFDGLMAGMETLTDSPTDYAQGIVDIARTVQDVFAEISKAVDVDAVYEDYARQIAEGVEQPTVPDNIKETFKPLTDMLHKLGLYFDPSGESLTKDFYLPTGAPSKKLASVEDAILHPERAVDADQPVDGSLDDILVDPMRIGSSGFWEKRSGELFLDEDGNFTMAKAGTLEENLTAYVVSALTRGQNRLLVAANNEVARSKYDRNRNQITSKQALAGLKDADRNRGRIRAAQLKNAKGYDEKLKEDKLNELADNYSDKKSIDAIENAYNSTDFAKEINYTRRTNEVGTKLGYRKTLTINPIKGSALRFGSNNGFRGIANDIRKASHITVTGTKWVKRYGEYVCVGFGMDESQSGEYEFTRIEPAVNLGDSANLMFAPDRAAAALFKDISNNIEEWSQRGGWGLLNALQDFARQNFPLLSDPEYAAQRMFQTITRDYAAYNDVAAFNTAVMSDLSDWIKQNAARNINSAIEMADLTNLDDRTINAIDTIMTKAYVGTAVYNSKIVSALQRATYSAALAFNPSPAIGNLLSEPERIIDVFGYKVFAKALKKFLNRDEVTRVKTLLNDLPSRFAEDREMVGLAEKAKTVFGRASEAVGNVSMGWLQKSEELKNVLFWFAAEENAKLMYPNDPSAQLQNTLRMFNDIAIAGGPGTTPGVANSNLGRMAFILKTFSLRNWDDFIEITEQIGHGRSGSYKWDRTNRGSDTGGQGGYSSTTGKKKFNYKKAGQFVGGTLLRRYLLWLMVLGPLGRSIWDALGGDPTGLTENFSRGLYDDEGTDEYEGMTPLDNIINAIPTGFILGTLKDFYFAARRAGVDTGNFFGAIDIDKDPRLQKDLAQHLPLGTMTRRVGDMLELVDRGYSFNSFGNKTYAAPQNLGDTIKGFMLGKNTTSNAQAYNKYRYGAVNVWGDIFEGDWLDFAMSANPFAADMGMVKMDTTRTDYKGVFHGSYNDVPTMQAAVADLRERRLNIIREYNEDLEKYTGQFEGLNDSERKAKAAERREKKIDDFTNDVSRLVDAYTEAGNALSDKQINTLMYLFDFNEGDEDTYDSQLARERYVEAGLPDLNPVNQVPKQDKETGEVEEQNYFQRSLVYQNAVQGRYGIPREAAKAVDSALADFKNTYKEYKKRVSDLNDKAYSASKGSAERKRLQSEVEKVQEEYLNQLYAVLTPVVQQYGTEVLSSNDVIESLQPYMSSMVPYSSIKKYGLQFNSGNDIVWGQLSDWVKSRWGASAPTAGSDPEITDGIKQIKALKDQGKTAQAKSQARLLLDRIARGSLSARNNDVIELRSLLYD